MHSLLIGLALLGGVTSQTVMDVSVSLIFLLFLKDLYQRKTSLREVAPTGIEWAFLGYFLIAIISLALNGKPPVPWFEYLSKFNWVPNLYILIYAFRRTAASLKSYLLYFGVAFLIPNLYALYTFVTGYDLISHRPIIGALGLIGSTTYHAHGNSMIFVFFLALFVFQFNKIDLKLKIFATASLVLMAASVFVSYNRGIWAATLLTLCALSWTHSRKLFVAFLLTAGLLGTSLYYHSTVTRQRIDASFGSDGDKIRLDLMKVHWLMFEEHPVVGIGYWDSYRQIADYWPKMGRSPDYFESHGHNQYLNVLATTGLLGLLFFLSILIFFARACAQLLRRLSDQKDGFLFATTMASFFVMVEFALACMTDVTFEYAKMRGILFIAVASFLATRKKLTDVRENDNAAKI